MAYDIIVPRLGWSMDEGTFQGWLKKEGEWVAAGEMLFVLEGDKAVQEIESFDSGYLCIAPDAPQEGDDVQVGRLLGYLVASGEKAPFAVVPPTRPDASTTRSPLPREIDTVSSGTRPAEKTRITPRARRKAEQLGVDWTTLSGSGRNGRIRERDIKEATDEAGE